MLTKQIWQVIIGIGGVVVGGILQQTTMPLWSKAVNPYFILLWAAFMFSLVFFIFERILYLNNTGNRPDVRNYLWTLIGIGVLDALNGLFVVFSGIASRTPPVLQALLTNSTILFSIPLTKWLIITKKHINYWHWKPITALGLLFTGITISIIPEIMLIVNGKSKFMNENAGMFYTVLFLIGDGFGAAYNVLQERYMMYRKMEEKNVNVTLSKNYERAFVLFWGCSFQFLTMFLFFPLDAIPHFGTSNSIGHVFISLKDSFLCNLGIHTDVDCPAMTYLLGILFIVGYLISYVGTLLLNEESANFAMFAGTLAIPISIIFMKFIPELAKYGADQTPYWSVIPSVICITIGVILWKHWENNDTKEPEYEPLI